MINHHHNSFKWDQVRSHNSLPIVELSAITTAGISAARSIIYKSDSVRLRQLWTAEFGITIDWAARHAITSIATPCVHNLSNGDLLLRSSGDTSLCRLDNSIIFSPGHEVFMPSNQTLIFPRSETVINEALDATSFRNNNYYYDFTAYKEIEHVGVPVFLLSSRWSSRNYYHWMVDCVPKISFYKALREQIRSLKILLLEPHDHSFHREFIQGIGIEQQDIITLKNRSASIQSLYFMPRIGPDSHSRDLSIAQKQVLSQLLTGAPSHRRLFVMRRPGTERSLANHSEVQKLLSSMGFHCTYLEQHKLEEQISLVTSAHVIVGPHGAGLTLAGLSLEPDFPKRVIEITHVEPFNPCFLYNSQASGSLSHSILPSKKLWSPGKPAMIRVDTTMLSTLLEVACQEELY